MCDVLQQNFKFSSRSISIDVEGIAQDERRSSFGKSGEVGKVWQSLIIIFRVIELAQ